MGESGIKNVSHMIDKPIEMLIENDSELIEAKAIIDEFSDLFYLFCDENWKDLEKDIDTYRVKTRKQNGTIYYIKDFELEEEEVININKKMKIQEIYYVKNGIKL
tara:strand:- start:15 stop:329 length:315 start_codon:yes stop_codon:yes gene_type:complete